jgi:hypothetical protein
MKQYILNILIGIDQFANTLLAGAPDETLSARAWRAERDNKIFGKMFRPTIDLIFWFDIEHCYNSYLAEKYRKQLGSAYE